MMQGDSHHRHHVVVRPPPSSAAQRPEWDVRPSSAVSSRRRSPSRGTNAHRSSSTFGTTSSEAIYSYSSLHDVSLRAFFSKPCNRRQLLHAGLVSQDGVIVDRPAEKMQRAAAAMAVAEAALTERA